VEGARQKALEDFNRRKAQRLEEITKRGKVAMAEAAKLDAEAQRLEGEFQVLNQKLEQLAAVKDEEAQKLAELQKRLEDATSDPRYAAKQEELQQAKSQVLMLRSQATTKLDDIRLEIAKLRNEQGMLEKRRAYFD